ncbi:MAG: glycerate kinase [Chloroflexi bacterium]|nr:glycerate kinase [Chloroflexota bacterium]
MKIVIAPQAFKGSLSALQAADAIANGAQRVFPDAQLTRVPVADGGDGTLDALINATGGTFHEANVTGPLGSPVDARWGVLGDGMTTIIEAAQACGLALLSDNERDPLTTTTYGVGELIKHALDAGYRKMLIGLGGSSTNDGGAGLAMALGARLLDANEKPISHGGQALLNLATIDVSGLDPRMNGTDLIIASDVTNPLCGPTGASTTFGPQKGASPEDVTILDSALAHLAGIIERDIGVDVMDMPGGGAAGGMGAGLVAFLGAKIEWGADIVCGAVGLDGHLANADLVITGEGRLDWQTAYNKAPVAVARLAAARSIPVLGVAGSLGPGWRGLYKEGFTVLSGMASKTVSIEDAIAEPEIHLANATVMGLQRLRASL